MSLIIPPLLVNVSLPEHRGSPTPVSALFLSLSAGDRQWVPLAVFELVNHHFQVVLGGSKVEREHERQGMVRVKAGTGR
jgi:hypothetical protein